MKQIKQPSLEELCKYFWELAKKYASTKEGDKEVANVEFCLKSEMLMNRVSTIENELNELKEFVKVLCKMKIVDSNHKIYGIKEKDIELIKKVVEEYGK